MEIEADVGTCDVSDVVGNKEYVVTDKGAKTLMIVGIVTVMGGVSRKYTGELI
jgi:hypothetical protein